MEHTCKNCGYAVGWIDNERFMMCNYYKDKVDGPACDHWKEKDMTGDEARQEVIQRLQALRQQLLGIIGELEMEGNQVI